MPTSIKQMTFTITTSSPTLIRQKAASLAAGENYLFQGSDAVTWVGGDVPIDADFNWNNKFHWDPVRGRAYLSTKHAGQDASMQHAVYDEVAHTWHSENCGFNRSGHVYDTCAYDHADGTGYQTPGGGKDSFLYVTTPTSTSPGTLVSTGKDAYSEISGIMYASTQDYVSGEGAMDIHPNLFGTADAGMVIICKRGIGAWRKSTNIYSQILGTGNFDNCDVPSVVYCRGLDAAIVCANSPQTGTESAWRVNRNNSITQIQTPPIDFGPDRDPSQPTTAVLIDSPNGDATLYALERDAGQVYKYTAGTWALQSFTHPFAGGGERRDFMAAAGYGLGAIIGIERTTGTSGFGRMRLWRPNS